MDIPKEMDKFIIEYDLPKSNQDQKIFNQFCIQQ